MFLCPLSLRHRDGGLEEGIGPPDALCQEIHEAHHHVTSGYDIRRAGATLGDCDLMACRVAL